MDVENGGNADKHEQGDVGSDAAGILEPLADVEADDVEHDGHQKDAEGNGELEGSVLRESRAAPAHDVGGHGGAGEQQAGK